MLFSIISMASLAQLILLLSLKRILLLENEKIFLYFLELSYN